MTVTANVPSKTYIAAAAATVFTYDFRIFTTADLYVTVDGVAKTLSTHYTVSGADNPAGGSVTFVTPMTGGETVVIAGNVGDVRNTDYQEGGDLLGKTHNDDHDRPVMLIKQLLARSLVLPVGDKTGGLMQLPSAATRALKVLGFGVDGAPLVYDPSTGGITSAANISFLQAGSGAVSRDLQEDSRETIKVTQFMSATKKADYLAYLKPDITAELQAVYNYIAAGGKVILPRGSGTLSDTVNPANWTLTVGDGQGATQVWNPTANKAAFKLGTSDGAVNPGCGLRDMTIYMSHKDAHGIKLNATVSALLSDITIEGLVANLGTRTNIAVDLDGRNISGYHNEVRSVRCNHAHIGFYLRTTGTTGVTQQALINCSAGGDYAAGDVTSKGIFFENAGVDTTIMGGNLEDCASAIRNDGDASTTAYTSLGMRFEANGADLQMNATGAAGFVTVLGSPTLTPSKVNDNSLHTRNVIQFGTAGSVGVTGQAVEAGEVVMNASRNDLFASTITGAVTGSCNVRYAKQGKLVTLHFDLFKPAGAGVGTVITMSDLPTFLRPAAGDFYQTSPRVTDNGAYLNAPGMFRITTAGGMTMFATAAGGNFTASANATGWDSFSVTYRTA